MTATKTTAKVILEYWRDGEWYVGRLRGAPGIFSQGQTLDELEENIREAYALMCGDDAPPSSEVHTKEIDLVVEA